MQLPARAGRSDRLQPYIFPLLFLKRISGYWDWEYARALEAFGGDEELARLDDNFRFLHEIPSFRWPLLSRGTRVHMRC